MSSTCPIMLLSKGIASWRFQAADRPVGYEPVAGVFEAGRAGVGHHLAHHEHVSHRARDVEREGPHDSDSEQVVHGHESQCGCQRCGQQHCRRQTGGEVARPVEIAAGGGLVEDRPEPGSRLEPEARPAAETQEEDAVRGFVQYDSENGSK